MEPEIREFYHERTAQDIIAARTFLAEASDSFRANRTALFVIACLAHILHGNRPYALSRRSHNIIPIPPSGPKVYKSVMASLRAKCARIQSAALPSTFRTGNCFCGPADALVLPDRSVDVVITSPPFLGSTHFLRQNRLRNWLVGWSYPYQAKLRSCFLEHQKEITAFRPMLQEIQRVLRPAGLAVFHVGLVRKANMAELLAPIFRELGFAELGTVWEDTTALESQGRTDRGGTHRHGFIVLRR